jgi:uncharacterized membrane protein YphA (DoxX/SURF4 family)
MDTVLWIAQWVLGAAFIGVGIMHFRTAGSNAAPRPRMEWIAAVPVPLLKTIGVLEVLGGLGLIVPGLTKIGIVLVPLAATGLFALMVAAAVFHARRPGETPNIGFNTILGIIAGLIAIGRFVVVPLAG